jgi:hypothetical protein
MTFKSIQINIIPHTKQRYDTCGDYFVEKGKLQIRISETGNSLYNMLVLVHELIEIILVVKAGVTFASIDAFDTQYEKDRELGKHPSDTEPGNDPKCPYRKEHEFATWVETALCRFMELNWFQYDETLFALEWKKHK